MTGHQSPNGQRLDTIKESETENPHASDADDLDDWMFQKIDHNATKLEGKGLDVKSKSNTLDPFADDGDDPLNDLVGEEDHSDFFGILGSRKIDDFN